MEKKTVDPCIYPPLYPSIHTSIHPSILTTSGRASFAPSIFVSFSAVHSFIHSCIYPSLYPSSRRLKARTSFALFSYHFQPHPTRITVFLSVVFVHSPEVVQGHPYGEKADVWAAGCILYQMSALKPPFYSTNMLALAKKVRGLLSTPGKVQLRRFCSKILLFDSLVTWSVQATSICL